MRRNRQPCLPKALLTGVAILAVFAPPAPVEAAERGDFPAERFRLALDGEGIVSVESGSVPRHGEWDAGLWLGFARNPLVLLSPEGDERLGSLVRDRAGGGVGVAFALFDRAQIALDAPVILYQARPATMPGAVAGTLPALAPAGFGDVRLVPKVALLRAQEHGVDLAVLAAVSVPSGGGTAYRGDAGPVVEPMLAVSRSLGGLRLGANLSAPLRRSTSLLNQRVGSELGVALGAGYRFREEGGPPLELDATLTGATSAKAPFARGNESPLEGRLAAATPLTERLTAFVGAGAGLYHGWGTPDWRVFGGLRWSERQRDRDNDRIEDRADACPEVPEDGDGFSDADGCPDEDNDGDGLADRDDACRDAAEDADGFSDADGCPDADNDGDGLADREDACRDAAEDPDGFSDADGCPDADNDGDGLADREDGCPSEREDPDGFSDTDGCPEADNDGDGVADADDRCPAVREDPDAFSDDDGCPDDDNDRDGVSDLADGCPDEAETLNALQDEDGCPERDGDSDTLLDPLDACPAEPGPVENRGCPDRDRDGDEVVDRLDNCPDEFGMASNSGCKVKQLVVLKADRIEILESVHFATGKDVIQPESFPLLENVARVLAAHPSIDRLVVEGHTDNVGKPAANLDLSKRRAASVVKFLVARGGVAPERLVSRGYGQTEPIFPNATAAGRAKNRRVVFRIVPPGADLATFAPEPAPEPAKKQPAPPARPVRGPRGGSR